MADFSVDLSAPQGAGTSPVAPVQPADTLSPLLRAAGSVVDIFAKGLENDVKQKALERKNAIVGSYIRAETVINQAAATGGMSPSEAAARSRANFNQYIAGNPDFVQELTQAAQALRGFTEKGKIESDVQAQEQSLKANVDFARSRGFLIGPDTGADARDAAIQAAFAAKQAEDRMAAFYREEEYMRTKTTFDQAQSDRREKELGFQLVNEIASANIKEFYEFNTDLRTRVQSGRLDLQGAREQLSQRFANISGALQSAARLNPELAAPYRTIFDGLLQAGQKAIDPATSAADFQEQFKQAMAKAKLAAIADPQVFSFAVASDLFGANSDLALQISSQQAGILSRILSASAGTPTASTPQVVGNPEVEQQTFDTLEKMIDKIDTSTTIDKEKAWDEASNGLNVLLRQTGELQGKKSTTPQSFGPVVAFMARPAFRKALEQGKISPEALLEAKEAIQIFYEPAVKSAITNKMQEVMQNISLYNKSNFTNKPSPKPKPLNETVEMAFTGSGVAVVPKQGVSLDPIERRAQQNMVAALAPVMKQFNTVLHASAHLKGGTNYEKEWKENRHKYFPEFFEKPLDTNNKADNKEAVKRSAREEKMAEQVADLPQPTDAEMMEYEQVLREALKRTDLTEAARAEIEANLARGR